ncbi:SDR family NAD(P)-dependent oxidoreductase [Nocardioides sp. LHG3406-4]|uniref:SDR family NAD(P)-dependent oxidoreductase n=1 Tax=Nocardioides sp. LHG3406-4 TaxID=2804575 RepID=UPI003CF8BF61
MGTLESQRIIVTGAAQGLGRGVVEALHQQGARVFATDLPGHPALAELANGEAEAAHGADLAEPGAPAQVVAAALESLGGVDGLVVCHAYMAMSPFLEQDPATWWKHLDINLRATFQLTQAVLPTMRQAGGGRIVFIGSEAGSVGMRDATAYSASKAGLATLAKTMARELGPLGIITNVVAPSYIDTPQLQVDAGHAGVPVEELKRQVAAGIPIGRVAAPAEIAKSVVYLLGPYGGSIIGQVINANGGSFRGRV